MKQDRLLLIAGMCATSLFSAMWFRSSVALAAPIQGVSRSDIAPRMIPNGRSDIKSFFRLIEFNQPFHVLRAEREELFGRRYYQIKIDRPDDLASLRDRITTGWTLGRFNRAVYQNNLSARVPTSRNLPGWWDDRPAGQVDQIMLDYAGRPNWYIVLAPSGEVCLMWVG